VAQLYAHAQSQQSASPPSGARPAGRPPQPQAAPPRPRSLVSAPSAGGAAHVPQGPGQAFDALFKG
jgi:hypothetical protein